MVKTCLDAAAVAAEEGASRRSSTCGPSAPSTGDHPVVGAAHQRAIVVHGRRERWASGSEIAAKLHEDLFYVMESPVMRVAGYDMPYPPRPGRGEYLPSVDRILDTVDQSLAY